jgi:type IV pilus assembly protein PilB
MGFNERDRKTINTIVEKPNGIILVTGPTGSGKTTTLYSILSRLNTPKVNIITVEDPIEYQMFGISQVQVNAKVGLTFAAALRSILRQDPDIVMIGETRDQETAQIAIQAALTGHLVLSTLHTNSAPASITRLIDMGIEPFLISSSIVGVIAQRLVRRLCESCKEKYHPTQETLDMLGMSKEKSDKITFYKPKGCGECSDLGYKGRLPLFEIMLMTDDISRLTMERSSTTVLRKQAIIDGMSLLIDDGIIKVEKGLTSIEEVLSVATVYDNPTELE